MKGHFFVYVTGTERTVSKDGKTEYCYLNCLQESELKKVRVLDQELMLKLETLPPLTELSVLLDVHEGNWNGKTYVNYRIISYETVANMKKDLEKK